MTALPRPGETPAERTIGHVALVYRRVPGMCATVKEQERTAAAIDMGREALALCRAFIAADEVKDLDAIVRAIAVARTLLARAEDSQ